MSDFLNNLLANVQNPGEVIQPRLGPLYGSPPMTFFSTIDGPALDLETEVDAPASSEPLVDASPLFALADNALTNSPAPTKSTALPDVANHPRRLETEVDATASSEPLVDASPSFALADNALTNSPRPGGARSTALPGEANHPRRNDSFARPEMDSRSTTEEPAPPAFQHMPNVSSPFAEPSLRVRAERDMQDKKSVRSSVIAGGKFAPLSNRVAAELMPPQLPESKMAQSTCASNISSEKEKPMPSTVQSGVVMARGEAGPSLPDFHSALHHESEERLALRESLRSPEAAVAAFSAPLSPFATLSPSLGPPQLRPYLAPQLASAQPANAAQPQAPTIRVNIGRIEVRAVTSPATSASPPARRRSSPQLSLEDYLKQRNGGRR